MDLFSNLFSWVFILHCKILLEDRKAEICLLLWEVEPSNGVGNMVSNRSNTRKSVSSDIQTLRSGLKKQGAAEFF